MATADADPLTPAGVLTLGSVPLEPIPLGLSRSPAPSLLFPLPLLRSSLKVNLHFKLEFHPPSSVCIIMLVLVCPNRSPQAASSRKWAWARPSCPVCPTALPLVMYPVRAVGRPAAALCPCPAGHRPAGQVSSVCVMTLCTCYAQTCAVHR